MVFVSGFFGGRGFITMQFLLKKTFKVGTQSDRQCEELRNLYFEKSVLFVDFCFWFVRWENLFNCNHFLGYRILKRKTQHLGTLGG
jgi:hypothetical protein